MRKPLFLLALTAALAACGGAPGNRETVRIGSKPFTEQFILGEIMAQMIEARTALKVERVFNLGGTMVCHKSLEQGDIDLYAEYTGTGLTVVLKREVISEPQAAYDAVAKDYKEKFNLEWLPPFGFNNTHVITVRGDVAKKNGWTKVSDLKAAAPRLRMGAPAEFTLRPDGYPGLKRVYGLKFASIHDMDPGLMYLALSRGDIDVIPAFSTDGRILAYKLAPLEDDKRLYPPYYAAPVVRAETLAKHPELKTALLPLAGLFTDELMQKLNYEVDEKKRSPREVAGNFLRTRGLISDKKQ